MKKHEYIGIWLLLAVALSIVVLVAFSDDISLMGYSLKKAPIAEFLLKDEKAEADSILKADSVRLAEKKKLEEVKTDSLPQTIFIFGDSMTFNLALRLAQYARQNGHKIYSVNWDSSNTKLWATTDTLKYFLDDFKPTQVFISLGSNELYYKNPEVHGPYVKKIIETLDTIPYVWIGPPNWNGSSKFNEMLARICKPGSFFRSEGMTFKRKKDKIHPTREASALWIDSIMRWVSKSSHPFIAETPSDSIGKVNPHITFLKALNK